MLLRLHAEKIPQKKHRPAYIRNHGHSRQRDQIGRYRNPAIRGQRGIPLQAIDLGIMTLKVNPNIQTVRADPFDPCNTGHGRQQGRSTGQQKVADVRGPGSDPITRHLIDDNIGSTIPIDIPGRRAITERIPPRWRLSLLQFWRYVWYRDPGAPRPKD